MTTDTRPATNTLDALDFNPLCGCRFTAIIGGLEFHPSQGGPWAYRPAEGYLEEVQP